MSLSSAATEAAPLLYIDGTAQTGPRTIFATIPRPPPGDGSPAATDRLRRNPSPPRPGIYRPAASDPLTARSQIVSAHNDAQTTPHPLPRSLPAHTPGPLPCSPVSTRSQSPGIPSATHHGAARSSPAMPAPPLPIAVRGCSTIPTDYNDAF